MIVSDPDGKALHLLRGAAATEFTIENFSVAADSQFAAFADQIRTHKRPYWGAPIYRAQWQETFLNYFVPIWSGDTYMGFAALGITTRALSTLAKELSDPPLRAVRAVAKAASGRFAFRLDGLARLRPFGDAPLRGGLRFAINALTQLEIVPNGDAVQSKEILKTFENLKARNTGKDLLRAQ